MPERARRAPEREATTGGHHQVKREVVGEGEMAEET
jgi:hypothetical protein